VKIGGNEAFEGILMKMPEDGKVPDKMKTGGLIKKGTLQTERQDNEKKRQVVQRDRNKVSGRRGHWR